jgi:DNA-directed RNA polymerase specialized sigma subunit
MNSDDRQRAATACANPARLAPPTDDLIARHLPLARRVARGYAGKRLGTDDLIATASLALVEAARKYDVAEYPEDSFARFAERCMRSAIRDALCRAPVVHMGLRRERDNLKAGTGGWTPYGIAVEHLGMSAPSAPADDVAEAMAALPEMQRSVFVLMAAHDLTAGQAARELGISRLRARAEHDAALRTLSAVMAGRN